MSSLLAPSGLGGFLRRAPGARSPSLRSEGTGSAHVCARGAHTGQHSEARGSLGTQQLMWPEVAAKQAAASQNTVKTKAATEFIPVSIFNESILVSFPIIIKANSIKIII